MHYMKDPENRRKITDMIVLIGIYACAGLLPLIPLWHNLHTFLNTESISYVHASAFEYLLAVGPIYGILLFSLPLLLRQKHPLIQLLLPWVFFHPMAFFIVEPLGLFSVKRIFQTPYVPVFVGLVFVGIGDIIRLKLQSGEFRKQFRIVLPLLVFFCLTIFSIRSYSFMFPNECFCLEAPYNYMYPDRNMMNAIIWIKDHTDWHDGVLTGLHAGTLVPAFAGNRVFVSWWVRLGMPRHYLIDQMKAFYGGTMGSSGAYEFLQKNAMRYVFVFAEEREYVNRDGIFPYDILTPVYSSGSVVVYSVTGV
jgi:hypothetical protein